MCFPLIEELASFRKHYNLLPNFVIKIIILMRLLVTFENIIETSIVSSDQITPEGKEGAGDVVVKGLF